MTLAASVFRNRRGREPLAAIPARGRSARAGRVARGVAFLTGLTILILAATPLAAQNRFILESSGMAAAQVATAPHAMVVSQEKRATEIGLDVLARGGNAVDAAVAVGFALAVTLPKAGNIGGGGFMLLHLANRREDVAVDYREAAPAAAQADIFLGPEGRADPRKSRDTGLGVGVPGTVAGLSLALAQFGSGKFTLADLIAPAVRLARSGIPIENDLFDSLLLAQPRLAQWPSTVPIFLKADGTAPSAGHVLVQSDLADTLEAIARDGPRAFYFGPTAERIVAAVREAGGVMVRGDLERYSPMLRMPVRGTYRGYDIVSMPPPSSGGIHLIEMLNVLEGYPSAEVSSDRPEALHLEIEAMKLAYADRAVYLGDSDRVDVPEKWLVSKEHAAELRKLIDPTRAQAARALRPDIPVPASPVPGSGNTTHFSVIDAAGNAVANTYTLNFNYGLGLVAGGTGILLNNELDDFAAKPGVPNAFGLVGGGANAPGPEKRPLSSMTPTIVLKDGRPVLVTGAPGGSRIITTVLQVIVNALDGDKPIGDAVGALRLHHQWYPDEVVVESGFPTDKIEALAALGHTVRQGPLFGSAHSIATTAHGLAGAADLRARGAFAAGN
ncbi:MAG: gamma-glutamyltransferase [Xanthobacteraceae bacterium]|nr:gamma-glutamyltransferase [Xanthobacteraceae bacterium]